MDGLALLCNLHADGPLTLRRLRQAGVRDLNDLTTVPGDSLATLLRTSPAQAKRFLQEAHFLGKRLEQRPLEHEDVTQPAGPGDEAPAPGPQSAPVLSFRSAAVEAFEVQEATPPTEDPLDELMAVRPLEVEAPPAAERIPIPEVVPSEPLAGAHERHEDHLRCLLARERAAARAPLLTGTPLRAGGLPGLDARIAARLSDAGVRTYRQLVDETSLDLARFVRLSYPRLLDLQYHARAFLARRLLPPEHQGAHRATPQPAFGAPPVAVEPDPGHGVLVPARPAHRPPATPPVTAVAPKVVTAPDPGSAGPFV